MYNKYLLFKIEQNDGDPGGQNTAVEENQDQAAEGVDTRASPLAQLKEKIKGRICWSNSWNLLKIIFGCKAQEKKIIMILLKILSFHWLQSVDPYQTLCPLYLEIM